MVDVDARPEVLRRTRLTPLASRRLRHFASSGVGGVFWLLYAYANIDASVHSHRVVGLGVGVLGFVAAALFLVRRAPRVVSTRRVEWFVAFAGTFGPSLLRPGGGGAGWGYAVGLALQVVGMGLGVCGYLTLRRSLGLVPAHRGLVTSGLYAVLRHPIYTSYVLAEAGYVVQSPSLRNLLVIVPAWTCQVLRIRAEERLLSEDPAYRAYAERTRRRLIPGIW